MSYRVVKKCNKRSENRCETCKYFERLDEFNGICNAPNKVITDKFNPKHFYCIEIKSYNDMSDTEKQKMLEVKHKKEDKKAFKEYVNKYFTKEEAKEMIKRGTIWI